MSSRRDEFVPEGYALVRLAGGPTLALPSRVAEVEQQDQKRKVEEREAATREEWQAKKESARKDAMSRGEQVAAERKSVADEILGALERPPEAGWYRVLPTLARYVEELEHGDASGRQLDSERAERRCALLEKLVKKGPDRRVAWRPDWRARLDAIESTMPHFRAPIELLRRTLTLADATDKPVRIPPMLLLGPPGVGKTHFSERVATDVLGAPHDRLSFDQPSGGVSLRGLDKMWGNSECGLLYAGLCGGDYANNVFLLDELDKACIQGERGVDPLSQLLGALEPQTARRMVDVAVDVEFDASLATYVATANSLRGLSGPLLSRLEVFDIQPCSPSDWVPLAEAIAKSVLDRLGLAERLRVERRGVYLLAHLTPRMMSRAVERGATIALAAGRTAIGEDDLWAVPRSDASIPKVH